VRSVKDAMSRDILKGLAAAGVGLASGAYAVVQMPELRGRMDTSASWPPRPQS
jgi:hypothetical protein